MTRLRFLTRRAGTASRAAAALATALVVAMLAAPAAAQDRALAEKLFLEGRALLKENQTKAACEKFEAAYGYDTTATGTLLNLALCNESLGRRATAWAQFRQVAAESQGRRADRVELARDHEAKLLAELSYLKVVVPAEAKVPGLRITLDKRPIDAAAWGSELPIDPGAHEVEISAPERASRTLPVTIGSVADHQSLTVPTLEKIAAPPPVPPAAPLVTPPIAPETPPAAPPASSTPTVGLAMIGVGAAGIATGLVFGLVAMNKNGAAKDRCPDDVCASLEAKEQSSSDLAAAHDAAVVANVAVAAGAVVAAAGGVLYVVGKRSTAARRAFDVAFAPTLGGGAAFARGTF